MRFNFFNYLTSGSSSQTWQFVTLTRSAFRKDFQALDFEKYLIYRIAAKSFGINSQRCVQNYYPHKRTHSSHPLTAEMNLMGNSLVQKLVGNGQDMASLLGIVYLVKDVLLKPFHLGVF